MDYCINSISKKYEDTCVLNNLSINFKKNCINVILGPSGCGKTTLLNIISGLDKNYEGSISDLKTTKTSYVFQEDRLLPWMTATDNVAFVLKNCMTKNAAYSKAEELLIQLGLKDELKAFPHTMSGGMKRRVAVARALAFPADVLLMDEAFSSLDLKTRISVMELFIKIIGKYNKTSILVSHDVREAIYLADYIICLSDKPTTVKLLLDVTLKREERDYTSTVSAELEATLYKTLLDSAE